MSRVLIDTNAYTALIAGANGIADILATADAVILSPVVIGEHHDGFRNGTRYRDNLRILGRFRAQPRTVSVPITDSTAEWFVEIKQGLRRRGESARWIQLGRSGGRRGITPMLRKDSTYRNLETG